MKIGDKVKIKPFEEIKSGESRSMSYGFYTGSHFFDNSMKSFCGDADEIKEMVHKDFGTVYRLGNGWWWLDKWLIPEDFLLDVDFDI